MFFSSLVKITKSGALHTLLYQTFGIECHSHLIGESIPIEPTKTWDADLFSIANQIEPTENIEPHIQWITDLVEKNQKVLTQVRDGGGKIQFTVMQTFKTPRGCQLILSEEDLTRLHALSVSLEVLSVNLRDNFSKQNKEISDKED